MSTLPGKAGRTCRGDSVSEPATRVLIVLEELPDMVPLGVRLRAVLKHAARYQRLKPLLVQDAPQEWIQGRPLSLEQLAQAEGIDLGAVTPGQSDNETR